MATSEVRYVVMLHSSAVQALKNRQMTFCSLPSALYVENTRGRSAQSDMTWHEVIVGGLPQKTPVSVGIAPPMQ